MKLWNWQKENLPSIGHSVRTALAATAAVIAARLVQMPEAYWAAIATLVATVATAAIISMAPAMARQSGSGGGAAGSGAAGGHPTAATHPAGMGGAGPCADIDGAHYLRDSFRAMDTTSRGKLAQ